MHLALRRIAYPEEHVITDDHPALAQQVHDLRVAQAQLENPIEL